MPLNEASAPRSSLTRQQKQEALAAIYGIPSGVDEYDVNNLRRLLSQDDAEPNPFEE